MYITNADEDDITKPFLLDDSCLLDNLVFAQVVNRTAVNLQPAMDDCCMAIQKYLQCCREIDELHANGQISQNNSRTLRTGGHSVVYGYARRITATFASRAASSCTTALMKCYRKNSCRDLQLMMK